MIRYKVYFRKIKQVCKVIVRDNEKKQVVLEYTDREDTGYPYREVKKRITVKMSRHLKTIRFTERYDMLNHPLYDGDIIKEHDFLSGRNWVGLVKWNKDRGQFIEVVTNTPLCSLRLVNIEKIGNIWENPELLDLLDQKEGGELPESGNDTLPPVLT